MLNRVFLLACLSLFSSAIYAEITPEQEKFCQGIGLMSGNLQQHLQQGQKINVAVEKVLDETNAPSDERPNIRAFLLTLGDLVKTLPLKPESTQAFIQLSCGPGELFGDETANRNFQTKLPAYINGASACEKKAKSLDELRTCITTVFVPSSTNKTP